MTFVPLIINVAGKQKRLMAVHCRIESFDRLADAWEYAEKSFKPFLLKHINEELGSRANDVTLTFRDDYDDEIVLDNIDSYIEAMTVARKMDMLVVYATPRNGTACAATAENCAISATPAWFQDELEKFKTEFKREIMEELAANTSFVRQHETQGASATPVREGKQTTKSVDTGDYITRAIKETGFFNLRKRDFKRRVVNPVCTKSAPSDGEDKICGACNNVLKSKSIYFSCLYSKCRATICDNCQPQHNPRHAMLRLSDSISSGRHRASDAAKEVLLSLTTKKEKAIEVPKKSAKVPEAVLQFDCKLHSVTVNNNNHTAEIQWIVTNPGAVAWKDNIKLIFMGSSHRSLRPNDAPVRLPTLQSGQAAQVVATMITPEEPGEYKCFWILVHGQRRICSFNVSVAVPEIAEEALNYNNDTKPSDIAIAKVADEGALCETLAPSAPVETACQEQADDLQQIHDENFSIISDNAAANDFDVISEQGSNDGEDRESSYVSIDSPLQEEEADGYMELTDIWQRLSVALPALSVRPDIQMEEVTTAAQNPQSDVVLQATIEKESDDHQASATLPCSEVIIENVVTDGPISPAEEVVMSEATSQMSEEMSQQPSEDAIHSLTTSLSSSASMSTKKHNLALSDTLPHVFSNTIMGLTQALASVGATVRDIQTAAAAATAARQSARIKKPSGDRGWVPKATQTNDAETSEHVAECSTTGIVTNNKYAAEAKMLRDMGFADNDALRALVESCDGNVEQVILCLLDD